MRARLARLSVAPDHVLIDGKAIRSLRVPHTAVVHGDARCFSIACASIIAKVTRDRLMHSLARALSDLSMGAQRRLRDAGPHRGAGDRRDHAAPPAQLHAHPPALVRLRCSAGGRRGHPGRGLVMRHDVARRWRRLTRLRARRLTTSLVADRTLSVADALGLPRRTVRRTGRRRHRRRDRHRLRHRGTARFARHARRPRQPESRAPRPAADRIRAAGGRASDRHAGCSGPGACEGDHGGRWQRSTAGLTFSSTTRPATSTCRRSR